MATTLEQLVEQAMTLPSESRAGLADLLVESLDADELGRIDRLCVQSTYKRLLDCLNPSPSCQNDQVFIGNVNYIDFKSDPQPATDNLLHCVTHKRKSFEHERELRAVIRRMPPAENGPYRLPTDPLSEDFPNDLPKAGVQVTLDLDQLIERIYVAPLSSPWFHSLVEKVVLRHKLDKSVEKSALDSSPLY